MCVGISLVDNEIPPDGPLYVVRICFLWSVVSADAHICWLTAIWDGVRVDPLNGVGSFASGVVGSAAIAKAAYFSVIRLFSSCCVWDFYEVTLFLQLASGGVEDCVKGGVYLTLGIEVRLIQRGC